MSDCTCVVTTNDRLCKVHGGLSRVRNTCEAPDTQVAEVAGLIYQHRWYGIPDQDRGRCNCHWDDPDAPGEITYAEHTRHVADVIVNADTGTGRGER
jgi:hypothetical protein